MRHSWHSRSIGYSLCKDECGAILSAELVIVLTIVVLGMITGLTCLQQAVVAELQDVGHAFRGLNQSYAITGFVGCRKLWGPTSITSGSRFTDTASGLLLGNSAGSVEIGAGQQGKIIHSAPTPALAPEGCIACPPSTEPLSTPDAIDCPSCSPAPVTRPVRPQPEIPMGPVPQTLPQI